MEITLQKAVLHILDSLGGVAVYSQEELNLGEESVYNFIYTHIKKMYQDDMAKEGMFREASPVLTKLRDAGEGFLPNSIALATQLFTIMQRYQEIPCADLLVAQGTINEVPRLILIKFNYKEGYTHFVDYNDTGTNNKIIVHKVIFASETQKNDEGAIINLADYSVRILEKAYELEGEKQYYFSNLFLEAETDLSTKESIKVINEVARDISERYYNGNFQKVSEVKAAIHENVESQGSIQVESIAEACFKDNPVVQQEYLEKVKEAGVPEKISFVGEAPEKKFSKHKIKTDNGIEISMPMEVYKNKDLIEFYNNPDGTISIILKNIGAITNR